MSKKITDEEIVAFIKDGHNLREAADKFETNIAKVSRATRKLIPEGLVKFKQQQILDYCSSNDVTADEAAKRFGRHRSSIVEICNAAGVVLKTVTESTSKTKVRIIAMLLKGTRQEDIATLVDRKPQWVSYVKSEAIECGIEFPPTKSS